MTDKIVTRDIGRSTWQGPESEAPRVKPKPREFWICLGEIFDSLDDAEVQYGYSSKIIHVREVLE